MGYTMRLIDVSLVSGMPDCGCTTKSLANGREADLISYPDTGCCSQNCDF